MNTCDLEEIKHQALQKCLELAETPELWTAAEYPVYRYGDFTIGRSNYYNCGSIWAALKGNTIGVCDIEKSCPLLSAFRKIENFHTEKQREEDCQRLKKYLQEALQGATQKTENKSKYKKAPWWKFKHD